MRSLIGFAVGSLALASICCAAEPRPGIASWAYHGPEWWADKTFPALAGLGDSTFGWSFTAETDLLLTELGFYDRGGEGLSVRHLVGVWDGNGQLLASATIPNGIAAALSEGYRYMPVDPVMLRAGQQFTIGATTDEYVEYLSELDWYPLWGVNPATIRMHPQITLLFTGLLGRPEYDPDSWTELKLAYPDGGHPADGYDSGLASFAGNFRVTPVPEPLIGVPLLLTAISCLTLRRRAGKDVARDAQGRSR